MQELQEEDWNIRILMSLWRYFLWNTDI